MDGCDSAAAARASRASRSRARASRLTARGSIFSATVRPRRSSRAA
jgi:hypothetical protein